MNIFRIYLTLLLLLSGVVFLSGQNRKKAIKKGNKYYQLGQYAKAIPFYDMSLSKKSNQGILYKLANCYRLTNQTVQADSIYTRLFASGKKVRQRAYLQFCEILMSNGNYQQAKELLNNYILLEPKDKTDAIIIMENIDAIKEIKSYYSEVELTPYAHNSIADDHGAVFLDNGIVFVSDRKRPTHLFKENNGTTGRDFLGLYFSERSGRLTYEIPEILPKRINLLNKNTGPASFTKDGEIMIFSQNDFVENNRGELPLQLFSAVRENGKWKNIQKINFCNNSNNYLHPAISADGKLLFFVTQKSKGEGGMDLYMSRRLADGDWSRPENLGPQVNTKHHEGFPFYSASNRLYFCSKGHVGYGGFDILFSEMDSLGNWSKPINVGYPINSSQDDISFCLSTNEQYGLFSSSRDGGDDDIYLFRLKKANMILSVKVMDDERMEVINDAKIKVISSDDNEEILELNMSYDKFELSLEKQKSFEIIVLKEGYIPYKKTINSAVGEETNYVEWEVMLSKKKD